MFFWATEDIQKGQLVEIDTNNGRVSPVASTVPTPAETSSPKEAVALGISRYGSPTGRGNVRSYGVQIQAAKAFGGDDSIFKAIDRKLENVSTEDAKDLINKAFTAAHINIDLAEIEALVDVHASEIDALLWSEGLASLDIMDAPAAQHPTPTQADCTCISLLNGHSNNCPYTKGSK